MIRPRPGISLIELLVVMSASATVLTLSSVLLVRAMHIQMQSRQHCDAEHNSWRLSDQFRADVHRATSAAPVGAAEDGEAFLRLQLAGGEQVEYSLLGGTVLRLASKGGKAVSREEFELPTACELSVSEMEFPPRLELTITANPDFAAAPVSKAPPRTVAVPVSLNAEAVVGRDLRLTAVSEAGETVP